MPREISDPPKTSVWGGYPPPYPEAPGSLRGGYRYGKIAIPVLFQKKIAIPVLFVKLQFPYSNPGPVLQFPYYCKIAITVPKSGGCFAIAVPKFGACFAIAVLCEILAKC